MSARTARLISIIVGTVPLWFLCDFYLFVFRAYLHLGMWPQPHQPDPKSLPFWFHYHRVALVLFGAFLVAPLIYIVVIGVLAWLERSGEQLRWGVLTFFLSSGLLAFLWYFDPGNYFLWFGD